MSADVLRRAASLMRERAEAATGPEWAEWHMADDGRAEVFVPNGTMSTETVLEFKDYMDCEECVRPTEADLLHVTSWHPAVALAVANLLDIVEVGYVTYDPDSNEGATDMHFVSAWADNLARAYLGVA